MGKNSKNNVKEEIIIKENAEGKEAALKKVFDEMDKKFGKGTLMKLGDKENIDVKAISSGSIRLNEAIGVGGYPRGRIIEIFGPESSGKTTLALHAIAEAQKEGGNAAFIDAEHALDPVYARDLGINTDELLISQPDNGEQALEITEALVRSEAIDIIVIDSVAALVPRAEIEGEMGDPQVGLQARLMSQALRKLAGYISKHDCTVIFINQLREKVGIMFGNLETTPGGRALKFFSSVRLDVRKTDTLKNGDEFYGNRIKVKVVKNKVAPPFKTVELTLLYGKGIDKDREVFDLGLEKEVILKSGSWYSLSSGERIGQGIDNAVKYLIENPDDRAKVIDGIYKKGISEAGTEA